MLIASKWPSHHHAAAVPCPRWDANRPALRRARTCCCGLGRPVHRQTAGMIPWQIDFHPPMWGVLLDIFWICYIYLPAFFQDMHLHMWLVIATMVAARLGNTMGVSKTNQETIHQPGFWIKIPWYTPNGRFIGQIIFQINGFWNVPVTRVRQIQSFSSQNCQGAPVWCMRCQDADDVWLNAALLHQCLGMPRRSGPTFVGTAMLLFSWDSQGEGKQRAANQTKS